MVDNSYKWAGGGILSTAPDLIRLADHLASVFTNGPHAVDVVTSTTLNQLWTKSATNPNKRWQPGLGWFVSRRSGNPSDGDLDYPDRLYVTHSGGAVGGTTFLLISLPGNKHDKSSRKYFTDEFVSKYPLEESIARLPPICVVILTNLEDASGISELAVCLAELVTDYALQNTFT